MNERTNLKSIAVIIPHKVIGKLFKAFLLGLPLISYLLHFIAKIENE